MISLNRIRAVLRDKMSYFRSQYYVESLRVFGSNVRGEQKKDSDLDLLVRFDDTAPLTLIDYIDLRNELSSLLSVNVDLVDESTLKPSIGEIIL